MAEFAAAERIFQKTLDVIQFESKRDKQRRIGPSDIGNPCDRCLGLGLLRVHDPDAVEADGFSFKGWTGTALHEKLERDWVAQNGELPGWRLEGTVNLGKIKGYGRVKGHVDLMVCPPAKILKKSGANIVDYKTIDIAKLRQLKRRNDIPEKYRVQLQCYGYGAEREGIDVEDVSNFFFARDHNDLTQASWRYSEKYNPRIVVRALERVERLWGDYVVRDRVELLVSHRECFRCSRSRRVSFKEM